MDRSVPLLAIGLVFGFGIGFVVAAGNGVTLDGHDHGAHEDPAGEMAETMDHSAHEAHDAHSAHDTLLSLTDDATAPTLKIAVVKDPMSGWNLHVMTENFTFSPEHASLANVVGEGHAHVHVNGTKIGRLYGPWMHIADLPDGDAVIEVTLNANDHRPLAVGDEPLSATVSVSPN